MLRHLATIFVKCVSRTGRIIFQKIEVPQKCLESAFCEVPSECLLSASS